MGQNIVYCGLGLLGLAFLLLIIFAIRRVRYDASKMAVASGDEFEVTVPGQDEKVYLSAAPKAVPVKREGIDYEDGYSDWDSDDEEATEEKPVKAEKKAKAVKEKKTKEKKTKEKKVKEDKAEIVSVTAEETSEDDIQETEEKPAEAAVQVPEAEKEAVLAEAVVENAEEAAAAQQPAAEEENPTDSEAGTEEEESEPAASEPETEAENAVGLSEIPQDVYEFLQSDAGTLEIIEESGDSHNDNKEGVVSE